MSVCQYEDGMCKFAYLILSAFNFVKSKPPLMSICYVTLFTCLVLEKLRLFHQETITKILE
jgi:hypothetical protein